MRYYCYALLYINQRQAAKYIVRLFFTIIICLFLIPLQLSAQELNNLKSFSIPTKADSVVLDSLSVIPFTFEIKPEIDTNLYKVDFSRSVLYWNTAADSLPDSVTVSFRTFPLNFSAEYQHKNPDSVSTQVEKITNPFVFTYDQSPKKIFSVLPALTKMVVSQEE